MKAAALALVALVTLFPNRTLIPPAAAMQGAQKRFCLVGKNDLADPAAPRFEQYPAPKSPQRRPAKLDVRSSPVARSYRTVLRHEMKQGANFAGHYHVATWGCGSSCAQFAIVDLNTGRVITADDVGNVSGVHVSDEVDTFLPASDTRDPSFRCKKDSRLLVVIGAINEDDSQEGAFYYVLKRNKLVLVHKTTATRNTCFEEED